MVVLATDSHPNPKVQRYGRLLRQLYSIVTVLSIQFLLLSILAIVLRYKPIKYAVIIFGFMATLQLACVLFGFLALKRMKPVYWFISFCANAAWLCLVAITIIVFSVSDADDSFSTELCLHVAWALWYPISLTMLWFQWSIISQLGIIENGKLRLDVDLPGVKSATN